MPNPLNANENVYIDHKIKAGSYSMPTMQAAFDHYTLGYIVSGDRRYISTETIRTTHAGDCGISKPHVYHRNCSMSDTPYDRYVLMVRCEAFQPIIDVIGQNELDALCSDYLHFSKSSQKVIQSMYENHIPSKNDKDIIYINQFDERIQEALIYIEEHLEYSLNMEDVATYVSLSPSHFSRLFKSVTGSSYTDYLTDVRIQHAQIMLATTNLSIHEIALLVGLSGGNYLSALFKKRLGISPREYKKSLFK